MSRNYIKKDGTTTRYTTRTFYVPPEKMETLTKFQTKCAENGENYSQAIMNFMDEYIEK
jgi:hypothetical protein